MKIYTKTGDQGETGLLGGKRVGKNDLAIDVCGELDEANSLLGMVLAIGLSPENEKELQTIQADLFSIGSLIAEAYSTERRNAVSRNQRVTDLETRIDQMETSLPELEAFILPGGCVVGAWLHIARSVIRRAERSLVELIRGNQVSGFGGELVYLNRLSDLLFVMARFENHRLGIPETRWLPGSTS